MIRSCRAVFWLAVATTLAKPATAVSIVQATDFLTPSVNADKALLGIIFLIGVGIFAAGLVRSKVAPVTHYAPAVWRMGISGDRAHDRRGESERERYIRREREQEREMRRERELEREREQRRQWHRDHERREDMRDRRWDQR